MSNCFEQEGFVNIQDNIVGLLPYIRARPTVYCGAYITCFVKRWADYLDETMLESRWGSQDIRLYAQYSEHSDSFAMFAVPVCKKDTLMPAVSGLRENMSVPNWQDKWFDEGVHA
jgi:hypothetical protein